MSEDEVIEVVSASNGHHGNNGMASEENGRESSEDLDQHTDELKPYDDLPGAPMDCILSQKKFVKRFEYLKGIWDSSAYNLKPEHERNKSELREKMRKLRELTTLNPEQIPSELFAKNSRNSARAISRVSQNEGGGLDQLGLLDGKMNDKLAQFVEEERRTENGGSSHGAGGRGGSRHSVIKEEEDDDEDEDQDDAGDGEGDGGPSRSQGERGPRVKLEPGDNRNHATALNGRKRRRRDSDSGREDQRQGPSSEAAERQAKEPVEVPSEDEEDVDNFLNQNDLDDDDDDDFEGYQDDDFDDGDGEPEY